jgi:hypothetical protein
MFFRLVIPLIQNSTEAWEMSQAMPYQRPGGPTASTLGWCGQETLEDGVVIPPHVGISQIRLQVRQLFLLQPTAHLSTWVRQQVSHGVHLRASPSPVTI